MATDKGLEDVPEGTFARARSFWLDGYRNAPATRRCARGCWPLPSPPDRRIHYCTPGGTERMTWSLTSLCDTGQIESNYDETVDSFDEMNLKPELLRGKSSPTSAAGWQLGKH
jgi:hypothetical protein